MPKFKSFLRQLGNENICIKNYHAAYASNIGEIYLKDESAFIIAEERQERVPCSHEGSSLVRQACWQRDGNECMQPIVSDKENRPGETLSTVILSMPVSNDYR
jgi:hypothetical protein